MITKERKIEICNKNEIILKMISVYGNKVILKKQLMEILVLFLDLSNYKAREIISELIETDLIKEEYYINNKSKVLILKKFAIAFVENKETSKIKSISLIGADTRIINSILKIDYLTNLLDKNPRTLQAFKLKLKENVIPRIGVSNLFEDKNNIEFYKKLNRNFKMNNAALKQQYKKVKYDKDFALNNFNRLDSDLSEKALIKVETLSTWSRKDIYITNVKQDINKTTIQLVFIDVSNNRKASSLAKDIIKLYAFFLDLFDAIDLNINFNIITQTLESAEYLIKNINLEKHFSKTDDKLCLDKIKINAINSNIRKNYLNDNIKINY